MLWKIWKKLIFFHIYIWLTISSCYGSIPLALGLMGRDGGLSTLCHSCGFACQQRVLKTFPGSGYLHSEDGVVWLSHPLVNLYLYVYIYIYLSIYLYIYIHIYTYIHQKTNFILCDRCGHQQITYFFIQIYFRTVFLRQCKYSFTIDIKERCSPNFWFCYRFSIISLSKICVYSYFRSL